MNTSLLHPRVAARKRLFRAVWRFVLGPLVLAPLSGMLVGGLATPAAAQPPAAYDLRAVTSGGSTLAWVPAIQDQGDFDDCWTFASATAIESNLLKNGFLGPQPTPPAATISSWHLSARNGAPESLVPVSDKSTNYGWGGFEYQTLGYLTRGQGSWSIPNVPAPSANFVTTMGGGPVTVSGTLNAFPPVLLNTSPDNLGPLLPPTSQTPAWQTRQVVLLDQGFSNNVKLPRPITPGGSDYLFNAGANDDQVKAVKQAILQYGAVTTSMMADYTYFSYAANGDGTFTVSYQSPLQDPNRTDHEVTIIGWNDSQTVGSDTGAWLVQNSWGTNGWGGTNHPNDGTFWASYNDAAIGRTGVAAFTMGPTIGPTAGPAGGYAPTVLQNELGPIEYAYDYNDPSTVLGLARDAHTNFASVLTPTTSGALAALGIVSAHAGTTVEYSIWSDWTTDGPTGVLLTSGLTTVDGIGYQLLDLASPLPLSAGDSIAVVLVYGTSHAAGVVVGGDGLYGVNVDAQGNFSYPVAPGLSWYFDDTSGKWKDFADKTYTASAGDGSADNTGGVLFLKGILAGGPPAVVPEIGVAGLGPAAGLLAAALASLETRRRRRPAAAPQRRRPS
jgi:hypothetical protein